MRGAPRIGSVLFAACFIAPVLGAAPVTAANVARAPDFSGIWAHPSIPGFEPLASGPTSLVNRARREGGVSDNRLLVGDYANPILKPEAAAEVKKHGEISLAGIGYPTPRNQCWPSGVPFLFSTTGIQFLQQPKEITILYFEDHEVRRIAMNRPHPKRVTPSWYGDSVGHFEGNTLVVDTVGIKAGPYAMIDWYGTPQSPALHVIERYRLLDYADAKEALDRDTKENFNVNQSPADPNYRGKHLQLTFTVEDPGVFKTPWSATVTYRPQSAEWEEYICAENAEKFGTEHNPTVPAAAKPDF